MDGCRLVNLSCVFVPVNACAPSGTPDSGLQSLHRHRTTRAALRSRQEHYRQVLRSLPSASGWQAAAGTGYPSSIPFIGLLLVVLLADDDSVNVSLSCITWKLGWSSVTVHSAVRGDDATRNLSSSATGFIWPLRALLSRAMALVERISLGRVINALEV